MLKRTLVIVFGLFLSAANISVAEAQNNHFVYIQTSNGQSFYLRMDDKLYSSTASGYLILSKLKPGKYRFSVGFPRNEFPEESFKLEVNDSDEGYMIMPSGSGTLILNMKSDQPLARVDESEPKTEAAVARQPEPTQQSDVDKKSGKEKDAFSDLLGQVVNDASIGEAKTDKRPDQAAQPKNETRPMAPGAELVESPQKGEIITTNTEPDVALQASTKPTEQLPAEQKAAEPIKSTNPVETPKASVDNSIVLLLSGISEDGEELVYLDNKTGDTVRVLLPYPEQNKPQPADGVKENPVPSGQDLSAAASNESVVLEKDSVEENIVNPANEKPLLEEKEITAVSPETNISKEEPRPQSEPEKVIETQEKNKVAEPGRDESKSACTIPADQADFLNLRKAIAGEADWDVMVEIVTKAYNERCFTTEQTKNLTYLFLTDEGKYRFLDATYELVSDPNNFASLSETMIDPYYVRRFKAMLR